MYPSVSLPPPLPLSHFYILLALARGPLHGYALGAVMRNDSLGGFNIRYGTLYRTLQALDSSGHIEDAGMAPAGPSEQERKHYAITDAGLSALRQELKRYQFATEIGLASGMIEA